MSARMISPGVSCMLAQPAFAAAPKLDDYARGIRSTQRPDSRSSK